jgi:integrase
LIPHYRKAPWLPNEEQWRAVLDAARSEALRNRARLAMSYDAALRREELRSLAVADIDASQRLLRIRAETTKNHQSESSHPHPHRYVIDNRYVIDTSCCRQSATIAVFIDFLLWLKFILR